jgi:hypothetical protein
LWGFLLSSYLRLLGRVHHVPSVTLLCRVVVQSAQGASRLELGQSALDTLLISDALTAR